MNALVVWAVVLYVTLYAKFGGTDLCLAFGGFGAVHP